MPNDFEKAFDKLHAEDPEAQILHLAYSAQTTSSYESALMAAQGRDYVTSIDTQNVSAGQTLIVVEIAELIEREPNISLKAICEATENLVRRLRLACIPAHLDYLRAGGRLSNVAFLGAQLLRIKPVIEVISGKLQATSKHRGSMAKTVKQFLHTWVKEKKLRNGRMYLLNTAGLAESVRALAEQSLAELGFTDVRWIPAGSVVASHVGPDSFGIAALAAE